MFQDLEGIEETYNRLVLSLSDPAVIGNPQKYRDISKERSELEPLVKKYREYKKVTKAMEDSRVLLEDGRSDPDLKSLAEADLKELQKKAEWLARDLRVLLLPKDPYDGKNVLLEIRAGAGGDESSLFAQDLSRMYARYAETKGWQVEVMDQSLSAIGGYKEAILNVRGKNVFSSLKYESGVHRVQRVPKTEAGGRIHTSTVTVAVLPEADEVDVKLEAKDLKVEAFGASGPGGQNVNRNYTAIRITHKPSGLVVSCQDEKSQHRNKEKALRILRSRLLDNAKQKQDQEISRNRKSQVGTGERSEKIRTYNFPQSRLTDHRINLSVHNLEAVLNGDMDELIEALTLHFQARQLDQQLDKKGGVSRELGPV